MSAAKKISTTSTLSESSQDFRLYTHKLEMEKINKRVHSFLDVLDHPLSSKKEIPREFLHQRGVYFSDNFIESYIKQDHPFTAAALQPKSCVYCNRFSGAIAMLACCGHYYCMKCMHAHVYPTIEFVTPHNVHRSVEVFFSFKRQYVCPVYGCGVKTPISEVFVEVKFYRPYFLYDDEINAAMTLTNMPNSTL